VEDVDCLEAVNVSSVLPVGLIVARPLDQVLEFPVSHTGIQYLLNFPLLFAIDFDRWGRWYLLARVSIVGGHLKFGDMAYRVYFHRRWELKFDGVRGAEVWIVEDFERSFAAVV
jgi:hypothetical protein